jgi:hypothetical protein
MPKYASVLHDALKSCSATAGRTKREVPSSTRGKSGDFDHQSFRQRAVHCQATRGCLADRRKDDQRGVFAGRSGEGPALCANSLMQRCASALRKHRVAHIMNDAEQDQRLKQLSRQAKELGCTTTIISGPCSLRPRSRERMRAQKTARWAARATDARPLLIGSSLSATAKRPPRPFLERPAVRRCRGRGPLSSAACGYLCSARR